MTPRCVLMKMKAFLSHLTSHISPSGGAGMTATHLHLRPPEQINNPPPSQGAGEIQNEGEEVAMAIGNRMEWKE